MSNITRSAKQKADAAGLTEEQIRTSLGLTEDTKIGVREVDQVVAMAAASKTEEAMERVRFPVALEPFFISRGGKTGDVFVEVPNRKVVVRQDTRAVLNVVSDRYKLIPHASMFEPVAAAIDELGLSIHQTKSYLGLGGGYARMDWVLADEAAVEKGDDVKWLVRCRNSYNYESVLGLEFGAFRKPCTNDLTTAIRQRRKHLVHLKVEDVIRELTDFMSKTDEVLETWRKWLETKYTAEQLEHAIEGKGSAGKGLVGLFSKKSREAILEYYRGQPQTVWHAYNALTWFTTHKVPSRSDRTPITQDRLQDAAYRFAVKAAA